MPASSRNTTAFKLPLSAGYWSAAKVRRLTAPGVDSKEDITFAGQRVGSDGRLVGTERFESVPGGELMVSSGEAVLVTLR